MAARHGKVVATVHSNKYDDIEIAVERMWEFAERQGIEVKWADYKKPKHYMSPAEREAAQRKAREDAERAEVISLSLPLCVLCCVSRVAAAASRH